MKKSRFPVILPVLVLFIFTMLLCGFAAQAESSSAGSLVLEQSMNDKNNMLTLEAYATAKTVSPVEIISVPTDIVLVLDQSESMNDGFGRFETCQKALQKAVCRFVEEVGAAYSDTVDHNISIVSFHKYASTVIGWTAANEAGVAAIKDKVEYLTAPTGATYMDLGLAQAKSLIENRDSTTFFAANGTQMDRRVLVVVFTDGCPGTCNAVGDYFSTFYDTPQEADAAVAAAAELKAMGAVIYTVGTFANADPAADYTTDKHSGIWTVWRSAARSMNGFMHFLSSDYGADCTSWRDFTDSNDGRNNGYYFSADTPNALANAFSSIVQSAIVPDGEFCPDSSFVLTDVLSDHFTVNGKVSVFTAAYDSADGSFGEPIPCDAKVTVSGSTVSVSGFDYSAHACTDGAKNGMKLIVNIPVKHTGSERIYIPVTSDGSGLFSADGAMAVPAPIVNTSIVSIIDLSDNRTCIPDVEKFFADVFGDTAYFENLWPTMSSMRKLGSNIYLVDYRYDYDIDDLMEKGVSSAIDLLDYASSHILDGAFSFRAGQWGTGCSVYECLNPAGDHVMGRNFDYMDAPCYVVWTHPEDAYASISMVDGTFLLTFDHLKPLSTMGRFQTLLSPYLCLDGLNEKGFAISVLQIHADGTRQDTGKTDMFTTAMIRCCLDKCATVDEAIELFKTFDVQDTIAFGYSLGCCFHYMLADANGDSAVIEYVNNEMRVIRPGDTGYDNLFVTNFYLASDGGVGMDSYDPEGMERYAVIGETLNANHGVLDFAQTFDLLSDVHLNYRHDNGLYDVTTLWSLLYNADQRSMSLAARMDYSSIYTFSVTNPMCVYSHDSVDVKTPIEGNGYH